MQWLEIALLVSVVYALIVMVISEVTLHLAFWMIHRRMLGLFEELQVLVFGLIAIVFPKIAVEEFVARIRQN